MFSPANRIAFIGGGNMARSLIGGLLSAGWAGDALAVAEPAADARAELTRRFGKAGVTCMADNAAAVEFAGAPVRLDAVADADDAPGGVVVLAVKPQHLRAAVASARAELQRHRPLLISIAAGIRCADILRMAGAESPGRDDGDGGPRGANGDTGAGATLALVRAMPNTPALVNAGIAGLFATAQVSRGRRALAESILRAVGDALWVEDEALLDTVTGISGSGPAYLFKWMELLAAAAEAHGLAPDAARQLVAQTALGAALLAKHNGAAPAELRRQVTSAGGVTEAALRAMEAGGLDDAMRGGIDAAVRRSAQMADEFAADSAVANAPDSAAPAAPAATPTRATGDNSAPGNPAAASATVTRARQTADSAAPGNPA